MTSEVLVMNRHAVALAADSAMTISSDRIGEKKYVKGVNKLFELSHHQPVGAMIFGSAELSHVPWEVVVKAFRDTLGKNACSTIQAYADKFCEFVESHPDFFPGTVLDDEFKTRCISQAIELIEAVESDGSVVAQADPKSKDQARVATFGQIKAEVTAAALPGSIQAQDLIDYVAKFRPIVEAGIAKANRTLNYPIAASEIADVAIEGHVKGLGSANLTTGVVIAGYGEKEYFPAFVEYSLHGFFPGKLVCTKHSPIAITHHARSHIATFAMDDMVNTFINGISSELFLDINTVWKTNLGHMVNEIVAANPTINTADLSQLANDAIENARKQLVSGIVEEHRLPLLTALSSLPVDEMAKLAETLITLEALKEKVTRPSESVGGAVDVAVITRTEGLVWVKRKHYFPADLNQKFMERRRHQLVI